MNTRTFRPRVQPRLGLGLRLLLVLCVAHTASLGQAPQELPSDPDVTIQSLDNGFRYYIRKNHKPENRAVFRLLVNTGSLLEKEGQRGLAHFLEHMAFNGTRNFEKQELVNFLERTGMRFGADLNAYTSFDETVYMLEIPMDDAEVLEKTFQILEDWAHQIAFDPAEIEKERGVIIEEWRLGRGAQGRLRDKQIPILFHQSRYAERLPIGEVDDIKAVGRDDFLGFYRDYYRPNLMALVAVGDFDSDAIEQLVLKHFAHLKNPDAPTPRPAFPVPDHAETLFSIETDRELQNTVLGIAYKREPELERTDLDYRRSIVEGLYTQMLNHRLSERMQEADPPFLYGVIFKGSQVRSKDMVIQQAVVKEGQFQRGLEALLIEARRALQTGFTEGELDRAKIGFQRSMEKAYEERNKTESSVYASEYTRNFLEREPIPGIAFELDLTRRFLPGIGLEEVNRIADNWMTPTNRVILYSAPAKDGVPVPTPESIVAVIESSERAPLDDYDDGSLDQPLIAAEPEPGRVVAEKEHAEVGMTEWTLSNGIRVLLKPTDFKNDQILLSAFSPGGSSLVQDEAFIPASTADSVVAMGGLGSYNQIQLGKKLAGKIANVSPSIDELFEELAGSASTRDLETLFQLVYLRFTAPRADPTIFESIQTRMRTQVENRLNDPQVVFGDAVTKALYGDHPRHRPRDLAFVEGMDLDASFRIYRERFADAGDFTFVLVGAFQLDPLKPLVEKYLASLPDLDREESWRDVKDDVASGKVNVNVRKGIEPKSSVRISFHGPAAWDTHSRYAHESLLDILRIRLREELREDKGGVYGVGVYGRLERWPKPLFMTTIVFGCDPGHVEDLTATATKVLEELKENGPRAEDLAKIKETHLRSHETDLKENGFWIQSIEFHARHQLPFSEIVDFPTLPNNLTAETIQKAARDYLNPANMLEANLYPEEQALAE